MKREKTGGRQKGTPNKLTVELKIALQDVLANEIEHLPNRLEKLKDSERVYFIIKILPYIVPKSQPVMSEWGEPNSWLF